MSAHVWYFRVRNPVHHLGAHMEHEQECNPEKNPRYEHMPYSDPVVVGAASDWAEAFGMAGELLRKGQLSALTITPSKKYPDRKQFLVTPLRVRGEPADVLKWHTEYTPLVHPPVCSIDMYLCEGRIVTPYGTEQCWRLDLVFS